MTPCMKIQISFPHISYQAIWTHFINIFNVQLN